jgi:two-component system CheB/CheR fusion protein
MTANDEMVQSRSAMPREGQVQHVAAVVASSADPGALTASLGSLGEHTGLSIIVVTSPATVSPELLPHAVFAHTGERLENGRIYVVREEEPVVLVAGRFAVCNVAPPDAAAALFSSIAQAVGDRAIGVVLSGMSPETAGVIRAIKEGGGTTIVQDPASAMYDATPRAAISAGLADSVLPPAVIGRELVNIYRRARASEEDIDDVDADVDDAIGADHLQDESFGRILALLKSRFRVDLTSYKLSTVRRRIERRMSMSGVTPLSRYAEHLRADTDALDELHDDLFIHVTQFFRDPESFEALRALVFPKLVKGRAPDDPIRIWVPGCSSGEEAYSIAIALTEHLEREKKKFRLQIFATDISEPAVERARRGIYSERAAEELGKHRVDRYFDRISEGYKLRKEVRELCTISRHDLTTNPPFARLDMISCRNVLIYFGSALQKRILPIFHYALKSGGFLWLGGSESAGTASKLFSLVDKTHKIYTKAEVAPGYLASRGFSMQSLRLPSAPAREVKPDSHFQNIADQIILSRYAPSGVIINEGFDILQYRGRTAPFLEPAPGHPGHNFLQMLHPQLLPVVRQVIQSVKKQGGGRKEGVTIDESGLRRALNIEVTPLNPFAPERERQLLVLFEERPAASRVLKTPSPVLNGEPERAESKDAYLQQLQQEQEALREHQQTLIEQFEVSQEELTSANEELQATNEEVQSTNEELESAKEELQSANEELTTMNDELQSRNSELVALNERLARGEDRFRLMIEGVRDYAIYMLDPEGNVTSWNEGALRLKGYEASEIIGRHYSQFFSQEDRDARMPVLELEQARIEGRYEAEGWRIRKDGKRFWANVVVTRINDSTGKLLGFSKVTRDLTERKRATEAIAESERRFRLIISGVRDYAIFLLDENWRVASWNEGARQIKGYTEAEILGKHFSIFYTPKDIAAGKLDREIKSVLTEGRMEDEGWRVRKDGSTFWANVIITRITDAEGKLIGFAKVTRDLSERKMAEEALRSANTTLEKRVRERTQELELALSSRDEFLSIASHELKTPLTGLKLQLQIAQRTFASRKQGPDGPYSGTFDRALRQTWALEQLIEDLLDISRIQTGRFEIDPSEVDVAALVEEIAVRFSEQLAQAGSELELHLDRALTARWDLRRMSQVLANLVSNAIKYAPQTPITISTQRLDGHAQIVVEDKGPGIPEDKQESIFERFERAGASPNIGGLGLGLFITRQIVEAHEGAIRVESKPGHGAKFIIELPLVVSRPNADEKRKEK